ncbi:uncharacterized protein LOC133201958 [Saccostrea echinata]|uniref:uncharacterized protein LOC133201958 n=1 Tax=Saccostrea echinata TaxID=191078 RepID=UPI002A82F6E6|nr:uncharacterized protein LOC133201958 [Saccostrea echinata]
MENPCIMDKKDEILENMPLERKGQLPIISMERSTINVYFWILLTVLICWVVRCGKLYGYSFPVYTTLSCPRNKSEWRNRSSDLNCTESNGYMCIPNENITELLEFCYRYPRIPIEKNICLILKKSTSLVEAYSCPQFKNGCPDKQYWSDEIFKYQNCLSIGNRCSLAEPHCNEQGCLCASNHYKRRKTEDFWRYEITEPHKGKDDIPYRRHRLREREINNMDKINRVKTEEEGGEKKSNDESLKNYIAGKHDNTLHLDETNETTDSSSEDNREKEYFSLDEDVPEGINSYSKQLEDSDRISLEELRRAGIHLDGYEVWKTEMSEKYKQLSNEERAALFLLLCSNKNTFILENTEIFTKRVYEICGAKYVSKSISDSIQALQSKGFVSIENEKVTFASDGVQDETMFDYLHTCWKRSTGDSQDEFTPKYTFINRNWRINSQYGPFIKRQLLNVSLESSGH